MSYPSTITTQKIIIFLTTLILSLHFSHCAADAKKCSPSACGAIRNISFPFHLESHCGHPKFELTCENDVTFIHLNSYKYSVNDINYQNHTIRLVDASVNNEDICCFPIRSSYLRRSSIYPYYTPNYAPELSVNLISCPNPVNSSSLFTDVTQHCASNLSHPGFTYAHVGRIRASEVPHTCGAVLMLFTSWPGFMDPKENVSLSEIHLSLLYGFELHFCSSCGFKTAWDRLRYSLLGPTRYLLIPLAILVFIIAGVSLPVTIIVGVTSLLLLSFSGYKTALGESKGITFIAFVVICVAIIVCLTAALNPLLIIMGSGGGMLLLFIYIHNAGVRVEKMYIIHPAEVNELVNPAIISGIIILAPRIIICHLVVWILIYKFRRRRLSSFEGVESFLQSDNKLAPIRYSYSDIKKMTKNFEDKLGQGGFGSVYKGKLRSGHLVAVKLLGKSGASGQDFINEIGTIGRIHHVNIVQLVGYCVERSKRALVFDFMPNGSLDKYVFNQEKASLLDWEMKFKIAVEVAQGIRYLHHGCDIQILHFDIKPHNILLDDKFVPKISDFGLAKLCSTNKEAVTLTAARGTIGYVAPELINRSIGAVPYKADVYSFGMLLMEMVNLNQDLPRNNDESSKYFPNWIYDHLNHGRDIDIEIVDKNDDRNIGRKMTIVALWCIQMSPDNRPSMNKVLEMLEGDIEHMQIPGYSSQTLYMPRNEVESWGAVSNDSISLLHNNNDSNTIEIISNA
ncbi:LEAF RUST 10 DISEASE-RESISTANCE LOCUS RECEPTOR-LIKE PROTEIN KINASE-like 2.5 [Salvia divinorum]|uniref:LEAF RUST 10 DISEASE-RESISTANCE LOCUS RECEPTOR-LIKE PROTEIN KINASE-like 2.5 n=1 Tax=Salvia divinorum TaxID=28513 RepID=A0ABD1FK02_SALDI